jgi:hypothetical protein
MTLRRSRSLIYRPISRSSPGLRKKTGPVRLDSRGWRRQRGRMRFGRRRDHDTLSVGDRIARTVDADLAYVKQHRLPPEDRSALAFLLMRRDGHDSNFLIRAFLAGYEWGEHAQVFLVPTSDEVREPVARAAAAYSTRQEMGATMSWEMDELAGRRRSASTSSACFLLLKGGCCRTAKPPASRP